MKPAYDLAVPTSSNHLEPMREDQTLRSRAHNLSDSVGLAGGSQRIVRDSQATSSKLARQHGTEVEIGQVCGFILVKLCMLATKKEGSNGPPSLGVTLFSFLFRIHPFSYLLIGRLQ